MLQTQHKRVSAQRTVHGTLVEITANNIVVDYTENARDLPVQINRSGLSIICPLSQHIKADVRRTIKSDDFVGRVFIIR